MKTQTKVYPKKIHTYVFVNAIFIGSKLWTFRYSPYKDYEWIYYNSISTLAMIKSARQSDKT
jgi:hypothetical protein